MHRFMLPTCRAYITATSPAVRGRRGPPAQPPPRAAPGAPCRSRAPGRAKRGTGRRRGGLRRVSLTPSRSRGGQRLPGARERLLDQLPDEGRLGPHGLVVVSTETPPPRRPPGGAAQPPGQEQLPRGPQDPPARAWAVARRPVASYRRLAGGTAGGGRRRGLTASASGQSPRIDLNSILTNIRRVPHATRSRRAGREGPEALADFYAGFLGLTKAAEVATEEWDGWS